ncbi:MAG: hypothetical protein JSU85_06700 [Candidatus Zixiibacteriota bacterium]|nr:MAG: hypothetical protein JSU85_06700 [candidate division Zixibacteria bacterium]
MMKFLKNRVVFASALFGLLDFMQGFVIASPILIYLRIIYENTESSLHLWPLPSFEIFSDFMINHNDLFVLYIITAAVLYILFFIIKSFFTGGIYRLIIYGRQNPLIIKTAKDFLKSSSEIWIGFLKVGIFGVLIYGLALFLGMIFGDFFGRFSGFLKFVIIALFLLLGSTYLQILKIYIASTSDISLKAAMKETRGKISKAFMRILIGNISVSAAAFAAVLILWFILKALKSSEWSVILMILTIAVQQLMVFAVCLGQSLRINFNYSVIKEGGENALGGDELG